MNQANALDFLLVCQGESIEKVKYLIETCDVDPVLVELAKETSLLHVAVTNRKGGRKIIEYLLEEIRLDIHAPDQKGRTLLHVVFSAGHTRNLTLAKYLLSRGAKTWLQDHEGNTVLHTAMDKKNIPFISSILENPDVSCSALEESLTCAGGKLEGIYDIISVIRDFFPKLDLDVQNKKGQTIKSDIKLK